MKGKLCECVKCEPSNPVVRVRTYGWGNQAFSGGNYFFWIPIAGPYIGAVIGAVLYELTIGIHLDRKSDFVVDIDYEESQRDSKKLMASASP
ncbi:unnamed protein product [Schistosoma margrebowiei]|uniref:Uncharacterized protein n=1 Tax=Schistosoma margrebowiei TaxID=48269 RepID=A0A183MBL2_9TREM|nr:unnamed protein product [Schistosoma margrebowiei]